MAGIGFAQTEAHETSKRFGYWEKHRNIGEMIALVHGEVAEAMQHVYKGEADKPSEKIPNHTKLEEELADAIIRILDISAGLELHLPAALLAKMQYNEKLSKVASEY